MHAHLFHKLWYYNWIASSEFCTYRLCEQRRFRRACASTQSRQNLRCSLIQAVSQEEPSDRKPDPWPLWMAGHAQLKFVMTECSKTQIHLTGLILRWNYFLCILSCTPFTIIAVVVVFLFFFFFFFFVVFFFFFLWWGWIQRFSSIFTFSVQSSPRLVPLLCRIQLQIDTEFCIYTTQNLIAITFICVCYTEMKIMWQLAEESQVFRQLNFNNIWLETIIEALLQMFEDNYPVSLR